ncbi:MAG: SCO family protein [Candidatus Dadabacteria bacterium]|nr:SCO family protein [Candidatus Dadabacteria bacterium]
MIKYLLFLVLVTTGCGLENKSNLPIKGTLPDISLTDFNENEFMFSDLKGKVVVLSYIYTNCPDICHITSGKLNTFKNSLDHKVKNKVFFVSISFDPRRDSTQALREHARMMNLNLENWLFVTGSSENIVEVLHVAGIDPWIQKDPNDSKGYTFSHRDRISLADKNGRIRMHYKGTNFDSERLEDDIRSLL